MAMFENLLSAFLTEKFPNKKPILQSHSWQIMKMTAACFPEFNTGFVSPCNHEEADTLLTLN